MRQWSGVFNVPIVFANEYNNTNSRKVPRIFKRDRNEQQKLTYKRSRTFLAVRKPCPA